MPSRSGAKFIFNLEFSAQIIHLIINQTNKSFFTPAKISKFISYLTLSQAATSAKRGSEARKKMWNLRNQSLARKVGGRVPQATARHQAQVGTRGTRTGREVSGGKTSTTVDRCPTELLEHLKKLAICTQNANQMKKQGNN